MLHPRADLSWSWMRFAPWTLQQLVEAVTDGSKGELSWAGYKRSLSLSPISSVCLEALIKKCHLHETGFFCDAFLFLKEMSEILLKQEVKSKGPLFALVASRGDQKAAAPSLSVPCCWQDLCPYPIS